MLANPVRSVLCLLLACSACPAQQFIISTFAGAPAPPVTGSGEVLPSVPTIYTILGLLTPGNLAGIAADSAGNVYYSAMNCVYRQDPKGVQTRIAGTGRAGFSGDGGQAVNAQLNSPTGLAVDRSGDVYIADNSNFRVRRVDSNGIITTVAGNGLDELAGDGGPAVNASLALSALAGAALAVDNGGDLFIADSDNERIRKVTPDGIINTLVRVGAPPYNAPGLTVDLASFYVNALAVDSSGNLFFAESNYNYVFELSPGRTVTTLTSANGGAFGLTGPCPGGPPNLNQVSLALDSLGDLFIASGCGVREYSTAGVISTIAGNGASGDTGDGGPAAGAGLANTVGIAVDGAGNIFVGGNAIRKIAAGAGTIGTVVAASESAHFAGDGGPATAARFYEPGKMASDKSGNVYVADHYNNRVRKISPSGIITTVAGNGTPGVTGDGGPATSAEIMGVRGLATYTGLAADPTGNLFISQFDRVRKVGTNGIITTFAGGSDGPVASGTTPCALVKGSISATSVGMAVLGMAVDPSGNLLIADDGYQDPVTAIIYPPCVDKVSPAGLLTVVEVGCCSVSGNGGGGVALDSAGDLVAINSNAVVKISLPSGTMTPFAGGSCCNSFGYSGDGGPALAAAFRNPSDIAADAAGNVYIADSGNYRIRKVSTDGNINTVAGQDLPLLLANAVNPYETGQPNPVYSGDGGPATIASLGAGGLAVDGAGNVYAADSYNNAIRMLRPTSQAVVVSAVVDAANESTGAISPGKIVVIYGKTLGPSTLAVNSPGNGAFGTQDGGTAVSFNGTPAPVIYSSARQVAAIAPYEIAGAANAQVTVSYQGQVSSSFAVSVAASAPSLFSLNGTGAGQVAAVNADGSINDAAHPIAIGGYVSLFATGEGQTSPAGVDGKLATVLYPKPLLPVNVTVGGLRATILYAGAAPTEVAGLMQVVIQIPQGAQPGGYVPVTLQVGTASSAAGAAWIAVSGDH